jgi:hypothetical protein
MNCFRASFFLLLPDDSHFPKHPGLTISNRSYRIGSTPKNTCKVPPLSLYACWPHQNYALEPGRITSVASAHIHAAACGEDGRLWAWGCGSNDGRCGVERFLNMAGEGKPPRIDAMKCYMMGPHRVGCARAAYWPHGPSLDGEPHILHCSSQRLLKSKFSDTCPRDFINAHSIRRQSAGGGKRSQSHGLYRRGRRPGSGFCQQRIMSHVLSGTEFSGSSCKGAVCCTAIAIVVLLINVTLSLICY